MDEEDLITKIHGLPPELFNQIRSEVLTYKLDLTSESKYKRITADYNFPKELRIFSDLRQDCAAQYFTDRYFVFTSVSLFKRFVSVLEQADIDVVCTFHLVTFTSASKQQRKYFKKFCHRPGHEDSNGHQWDRGDYSSSVSTLVKNGELSADDEAIPAGGDVAHVWELEWA